MNPSSPSIVVIGGPNGAGKTTISRPVINEVLGLAEFVNADIIAQGLSGFDPERAALQAGRIMLSRLRELAAARQSFAFESTLASRTFAPWLIDLQAHGYRTHFIFVWLKSPDLAIRRVKRRVSQGGHFVPDDVVRRRYQRGIANFIKLYRPQPTLGASTITRPQPNRGWSPAPSRASSSESPNPERLHGSRESPMSRQPKKTVTDYFRSGTQIDNAVRRSVRSAAARSASRNLKARKSESRKAA